MDIYWNIFTMHGPMNVKFPNNTSKWQMEFNSAFKGLMWSIIVQCFQQNMEPAPSAGLPGSVYLISCSVIWAVSLTLFYLKAYSYAWTIFQKSTVSLGAVLYGTGSRRKFLLSINMKHSENTECFYCEINRYCLCVSKLWNNVQRRRVLLWNII
jgi:hypothetical protein